MSKLRIMSFKDGRKAYSSGGIEIKVNKEEPISVTEINADENQINEFFANAGELEANVVDGKLKLRSVKKKPIQ